MNEILLVGTDWTGSAFKIPNLEIILVFVRIYQLDRYVSCMKVSTSIYTNNNYIKKHTITK